MERLTEKLDKMIWFKDQGLKIEPCEMNAHHCRMILEKLADYEDLEEQGLLVRLPCKVGTEVYYILGIPNKMPCTIDKCVFELSDINKIGESLFLTCEEAEKKLEEIQNDKT